MIKYEIEPVRDVVERTWAERRRLIKKFDEAIPGSKEEKTALTGYVMIQEYFTGPNTQDFASRALERKRRIVIAKGMIGEISIPLPPKTVRIRVRTNHSHEH